MKIVRLDGDVVKIGIEAPKDVPVHRQEVYDEIQRNNKQALTSKTKGVPQIKIKKSDTEESQESLLVVSSK